MNNIEAADICQRIRDHLPGEEMDSEEVLRMAETALRELCELFKGAIPVKIKRELFSFSSEQDWINKAQSRYANCGVARGMYITVDAAGHVMHRGHCFSEAAKAGLYPVTVYELATNWDAAQKPNQQGCDHA